MVEHDKNDIAIDPVRAYHFFSHYSLETLQIERLGTFTDKILMNETLLKLFDEVSQTEISKTEGCRIFFVESESKKRNSGHQKNSYP